jgi:hypothetical protein
VEKCQCGRDLSEVKKEVHDHKVEGIKFRAPAKMCPACGEAIFEEEDYETVFDSFDDAVRDDRLNIMRV